MYDPHSREPRGFAFVTMDGPDAAEAAIAGMNGVDLQGRVLSVQKVSFVKRSSSQDSPSNILCL